MEIRQALDSDWQELWPLLEEVFSPGDTYAIPPDISCEQARVFWTDPPCVAYVGQDESGIVGTYYLKPNLGGPGSHVCNAGFVVRKSARGRGVGRRLGEHALSEAARVGFEAMQFNCVVSANRGALELWKDLGFRIVGTVPAAFRHPQEGKVDSHIMFRELV